MGTARIKRGLPKLSWPIFQERIIPQAGNFNLANIKNIKITVKLDQITEGHNFHRRRYQSLPICNLYKRRVFASLDDFASQQYPSLGHFSARSGISNMLSNYKADQVLFITFFFTFLHILPHDRWPKIGPATKSILCLSGLTRIWLQWQPCIVIAFSKPQLATWRCRKSFKILDKNWRVLNQI